MFPKITKIWFLISTVLFTILLVNGCGSSSNTTISGVVIDGYWRGVKVCIDRNRNKVCDSEEPQSTTVEKGKYTITASPADVNNYSIVAEGIAGETYDEGSSAAGTSAAYLAKDTTLVSTPSNQEIVTPITTLVSSEMDGGKTQEAAENTVASLLGINTDKLYSDYEEENNASIAKQALRATEAIQKQDNNYIKAITELQEEDNQGVTASNFTYTLFIGNSAKTFNWLNESNATDDNSEGLSAVVKTQGEKGSALVQDEEVTYAPDANRSGSDTFTLTIKNAGSSTKDIVVTVEGIDTVAPNITSTFPVSAASDVAINESVSVTFSEEMNSSTITTATGFLKDQSGNTVSGSVSSIANTFSFTPSNGLAYKTTYTATLTAAMKDTAGNALAKAYNWSFTTGAYVDTVAPTLVSSIPSDGAVNIDMDSNITLNFSEAIKPSSVATGTIILKDNLNNTVDIAIVFVDTDTIRINPAASLSPGTTYTLTLTKGIIDDAGNAFGGVVVGFSTKNVTPPSVSGTYPGDEATLVGPYTWIDINFSEPMDESTLTTDTIALSGGKACQSVEYNATSYSARCYPYVTSVSNKLDDDVSYTVTLSSDIKSSAGGALEESTFSFSTGSANKLPRLKTGQADCFDRNDPTATIACTDTDAIKSDGWYVQNEGLGLDRSFSRDGTLGIVTDSVTGLQWEDDAAVGVIRNWNATEIDCNALSLDGGEWRMPSVHELLSISNKAISIVPNYLFTDFVQQLSGKTTWSSEIYLPYPSSAWKTSDRPTQGGKSYTSGNAGRCVRGTVSQSEFTRDANSEIVLDAFSGLMWQDNSEVATNKMNLIEAIDYCEDLNLGGHADWRLPNYNELNQLADVQYYDPALPPEFKNFISSPDSDYYWTSTMYANTAGYAWFVSISTGTAYYDAYDTSLYNTYVRCVRGGRDN